MLSPLEPKQIWIERLDVKLAHGSVQSQSLYDATVHVDVKRKAGEWSFLVKLAMTLAPQPDARPRYERLEIATAGIFDLPQDTDENFVKQVVPINCLAILHGFSRGVVAQVTGVNPGGPVLLPVVNFLEVMKAASRPKRRAVTAGKGKVTTAKKARPKPTV